MKMQSNFIITCALIFAGIVCASCSSNENTIAQSDTASDYSALYDKWWYDSNDKATDMLFASSGEYRQRIRQATGIWAWEDKSEGILKITNLEGTDRTFPDVWYKINAFHDSTMRLRFSFDGINFDPEEEDLHLQDRNE